MTVVDTVVFAYLLCDLRSYNARVPSFDQIVGHNGILKVAGHDNESCLRRNVLLCEVVEDLVSFGIWSVTQLGSDGNVVGK